METIGDAYMVAAGLLDTSKQHAQAVTNQAFGMREEAGKVMEPVNDKSPIQVSWPMYISMYMTNGLIHNMSGSQMERVGQLVTTSIAEIKLSFQL